MNIINYDDNDLTNITESTIMRTIFKLNDIYLLDNVSTIIFNNIEYTLIKIICNKKIKIFLKNIEKYFEDEDINILIDYDINTNNDYYKIILNKKIVKLNKNLDINTPYDIGLSIYSKDNNKILWKLYSIEINNKIEEFECEPDYESLMENLLNKIIKKKYKLKNNIENLEILYKNIKNNFSISEIDNYNKLIN